VNLSIWQRGKTTLPVLLRASTRAQIESVRRVHLRGLPRVGNDLVSPRDE
jgi:hypothetical protein